MLRAHTVFHCASVRSLYIHVPFCAAKCHYCAFFSAKPQGDQVDRYVAALVCELELVAPQFQPKTIFFGGGTPSLLTLAQWDTLLSAMDRLGLTGAGEWTVECNPATVSSDKARLLAGYGVNRISMGVQSLDEGLLERLGRVHTRDMVFRSVEILRSAGIHNLNIDLMFAIPGQTREIWRRTLQEAVALRSEHLSSYEVIYEEDTALYAQMKAGEFDVDEDLACEMYEDLIDIAGAHGFRQYEVANFARERPAAPTATITQTAPAEIPHHACRHNVNYWRGGEFHGLGPSAAGFIEGVRTKNWSNTQLYCEQLEKGQRAIESSDRLSPLARAGEIAGFGLRMNAGWPLAEFKETTGFDLREHWQEAMQTLVAEEHAVVDPERFALTAKGLRFADRAASLFLLDPKAAQMA